jgi:hypothetical protein
LRSAISGWQDYEAVSSVASGSLRNMVEPLPGPSLVA